MRVLSSIILLIIFFTGCSNSPQYKIIGEWETGNLGSSGTEEKSLFIFKKDLTGTIVYGNGSTELTWSIDDTKEPIRIEVIANNGASKRGIMKFITDDKILMRLFIFEEDFINEFLEGDELEDWSLAKDQVVLTRK